MLEWLAGGHVMMNEVPTKRAKAAVPKAREKQVWAAQPWQERALLSQGTLQHCGDRGEADLHEGQAAAAEKALG